MTGAANALYMSSEPRINGSRKLKGRTVQHSSEAEKIGLQFSSRFENSPLKADFDTTLLNNVCKIFLNFYFLVWRELIKPNHCLMFYSRQVDFPGVTSSHLNLTVYFFRQDSVVCIRLISPVSHN